MGEPSLDGRHLVSGLSVLVIPSVWRIPFPSRQNGGVAEVVLLLRGGQEKERAATLSL